MEGELACNGKSSRFGAGSVACYRQNSQMRQWVWVECSLTKVRSGYNPTLMAAVTAPFGKAHCHVTHTKGTVGCASEIRTQHVVALSPHESLFLERKKTDSDTPCRRVSWNDSCSE